MIDKTVLLMVSFGSSYKQTRDADIGGIETEMQKAYPQYQLRRAFTSHAVLEIIEKNENDSPDDLCQALDKLINEGIKHVIVQPTHVVNGREYQNVLSMLSKYTDKFESIKVGAPLIGNDADIAALADVLIKETEQYAESENAIVYVGHGVRGSDNGSYFKLQQRFIEKGLKRYFVGALQAAPTRDDVIETVRKSGAKKVILLPLMITAGSHACRNIAGDDAESWKSAFQNAGFEAECILKGLGQYRGVCRMFAEHISNAN